MNPLSISPLSSELSGIWAKKAPSKYQQKLWQIFRITTLVILFLTLVNVIDQISLIPVVVLFLFSVIIIILDVYLRRFPIIIIPLSQLVIFISITYLYLYNLFTHQANIFEAVVYSIFPNLIDLILGIIILFRLIIGIEIIRESKSYDKARVPLSKYPYESFQSFLTNLQLSSSDVSEQFREESLNFRLKSLFYSFFLPTFFLMLLLTPLWLVMLGIINIYPYIILIPTILVILILLIYFLPTTPEIPENGKMDN